jgi:hypothetical protein
MIDFDTLFWRYRVNAVLSIDHEIDSAFWKEWQLFRLPGGLGGFLRLHLPLLLGVLYGLAALARRSPAGLWFSLLLRVGGLFAFGIHTYFLEKGPGGIRPSGFQKPSLGDLRGFARSDGNAPFFHGRRGRPMITQLGFRIALGLHVLLVGIVLRLVHANRKRSNPGGPLLPAGRRNPGANSRAAAGHGISGAGMAVRNSSPDRAAGGCSRDPLGDAVHPRRNPSEEMPC